MRSISRNGIAVGTLWGLATKANKERFRPSEDWLEIFIFYKQNWNIEYI